MFEMIAEQSNLFAVQQGKVLDTNVEEQIILHGMLFKMGIVNMPWFKIFWAEEFRVNAIADLMPRTRFEYLHAMLHFADNNNIETARDHPAYDRFAKIRPLLDMFLGNCRGVVHRLNTNASSSRGSILRNNTSPISLSREVSKSSPGIHQMATCTIL
jgi:hypothetical protein